jgi:hypothetical protein
VERRRHQDSVAAGIADPVEVPPAGDAASREEPLRWETPAERLHQLEIDPTPGSDPTHIQHQEHLHS